MKKFCMMINEAFDHIILHNEKNHMEFDCKIHSLKPADIGMKIFFAPEAKLIPFIPKYILHADNVMSLDVLAKFTPDEIQKIKEIQEIFSMFDNE